MLPTRTAVLIALAVGVALEVGTLGASRTSLPVAVVVSAALGFFTAGYGWLAPAVIGPAEFAAALYRGGNMASNWLGPLAYYVGLSLPMVLAGFVGRRLRGRLRTPR